jgi:hypothetical protein
VELEIRQPELWLSGRQQAVQAFREVSDFSYIQTAGGLVEMLPVGWSGIPILVIASFQAPHIAPMR